MKKILLTISLLFISCIYAQPKSFQSDLMVERKQVASPLRLDRESTVYFDGNSITGKYEATYDPNGKQTLFIYYNWDTNTQSFVPSYKSETAFDENGNQTLKLDYAWSTTTQSFVPNSKQEPSYDVNKKQILNISYFWDTTSQSFVLHSKYETTYDTNGNQTLIKEYTWNTTTQSFVTSWKDEYAYDTNGNLNLNISYFWNTSTQSFVTSWKNEYAYDANGNRNLYLSYTWDTNTQSLVPNIKSEYSYDSNGNQNLYIRYSWDTASQSFVPLYKDVRTYNDGLPLSINLTQWMIYKWYSGLGVYKPSFKKEYSTVLDADTQLQQMGITYQYDTNFNVWKKLEGEEFKSYFYHTKTASLSTEKLGNSLISLYPNPTSQLLYVSHPEINSFVIKVKDLNGKQMYSGTIQKDVPLDVSNYTQGMYFVTIENKENNKKKTYKIIKK